jgi:ABC-2 type transport system ATP-binding protein
MTILIETQAITRRFNDTLAVKEINLSVPRGDLFGLVGPDGAGKTTFLRLLAGLLNISSGEATVAGHDLRQEPEAIKSQIGYMAQEFSLYAKLSVLENLRFFAELYDVPPKDRERRTATLLSFAGLTDFKNRRAMHLSGGMQKKLALACTLIHKPPLLLLDEPTTGVDPISRREFWHILTELHLEGTTIIVSTPYMDEADRCSRVGLMYEGEIVICDTPQRIRENLKGEMIELVTEEWQQAHQFLKDLPGVHEVQSYGDALHILVDSGRKRLREIKRTMRKENLPYKQARLTDPRMEEAFISLIREMERR